MCTEYLGVKTPANRSEKAAKLLSDEIADCLTTGSFDYGIESSAPLEKNRRIEDDISTKTLLNTLQNLKSHFRLWFLCTQSNCKRRLAYKWEMCCRVRSFQSAWLAEYDLSPGSFIFSLCSARFDAGRLQTCNNLFVKAICKFHLSFSWRFEPKKEKRNHGNMLCSERPLLQSATASWASNK